MQKSDISIRKKDSKFISTLKADINRRNKIDRTSNVFILDKKLKFYKEHDLLFRELELPDEAFMGSVWLIKNNSIIEFYSFVNHEDTDIRLPTMQSFYKSVVTIYNLNLDDIGDFNNANCFVGMDELISYNVEKTINFMIALIRSGFDIYLKV